MPDRRVVVVGTTSDYVDIIWRRFPGRAVFLTDAHEREAATEATPDAATEALCDLTQPDRALSLLVDHLRRHRIQPSGVACYDCESMALAVHVARSLSLPYPSAEAVAACRSKLISKQLWRRAGLPCPEAASVSRLADALGFMDRIGGPVVLKPLTGSGSEYTFGCADHDECAEAFRTIEACVPHHPNVRMYAPSGPDGQSPGTSHLCAIEALIQGAEYSCDFVIDGDRVEVIRFAGKVPAPGRSFGTTLAYVVPAELPPEFDVVRFRAQVREAASAVGLDRALGMLDFIVRGSTAVMLEIAPRPGGDCLPPLLLRSAGLDVLGAALDFAEGRPVPVPEPAKWRRLVGLRLFADQAGVLAAIDAAAIREDRRVVECFLKSGPGHRVVLPPDDYDSRLLGHVVFEPTPSPPIECQCSDIAGKLQIEMQPS
jgi:biotin carboxylase